MYKFSRCLRTVLDGVMALFGLVRLKFTIVHTYGLGFETNPKPSHICATDMYDSSNCSVC